MKYIQKGSVLKSKKKEQIIVKAKWEFTDKTRHTKVENI